MDYRKLLNEGGTRRGATAVAAFAVSVMLSACGGGGNASSPVSQAQPQMPTAPQVDTRTQDEAAALAQAMTMARTINANPMLRERPRVAGN